VEGLFVAGMTVRKGEVNTDTELNLAASEDIFEETVAFVEVDLSEFGLVLGGSAFGVIQSKVECSFFQLGHVEGDGS